MSDLFTSHRLGDLTLPNRVVMAPMTRARGTADGLATESMATYFAQRASAGLLISDGVPPNLVGSASPGIAGLRSDAEAESWRQVTDAVHAESGRIFAQIMHGGRMGHVETTGVQPVGPSAVTPNAHVFTAAGFVPALEPRELATSEVAEQAESYAAAARRAIDAGFDGVELHGANGYLISQFLSSNANLRTDRYGGSIANRIRFAVEAMSATVDAIGADRVGIRLSPGAGLGDVVEDGMPELYGALLDELGRLDPVYVHLVATAPGEVLLDMRRRWKQSLIINPSSWLTRGDAIFGATATDRASADHWLGLGADLISFGRPFLANPDLVERLRHGLLLAEADVETYYTGGDRGFIDYPPHQEQVA
ncbi:N-ethylmaleimide reductase [Nocardioides luteus]|uniref:Alkene reductase n=1 Tax=Nocardioides luteus TaxID=1844 RepID=A0ABQ5SY82_9ACTN|nr:alkene reductase [Nocardioides luteus]MDR7312893.1 N-ethylmaleimide reductase [Nocardioides luteus]GGR48282.1 alkene reductase [Nocardioides luteus]GLJ69148.1 alkene reductase [Nocardioides luteus]